MNDDFSRLSWTNTADKTPWRQGFYNVRLADDRTLVAEWRSRDKQGPRWWAYIGENPTAEKLPHPLDDVQAWAKASKAAIDSALQREMTVAEHIEKAYRTFRESRELYPAYDAPPPARRQLAVGDEIDIGNLKDCRVVEVRDEGRVVIFTFSGIRRSRDDEAPAGPSYRAASWLDVIACRQFAAQTQQFAQRSVLNNAFTTRNISSLLHMVTRGLDDQPDFQRGYVWTAEDDQAYLDAVMAGRDLGRFITVSRPYPHNDWLLDGKQRLNCLMRFFRSEIAWRGVFWDQLSARDRGAIEDRAVHLAQLDEVRFTRADLLRIFLEVNTGGVPQSESHLAHVRTLLAEEEAD